MFLQSMLMAYSLTNAAKVLHQSVFSHILSSPMSFFDKTPTGRIMNRLSKDVDNLDHLVRITINKVKSSLSNITISLILMSIVSWQVVTGIIVLTILFLMIQVCIYYVLK